MSNDLGYLLIRAERYSERCVSERLDPDYAKAITEMKSALKDCRNELCLKCGDYRMAHKGACDECRWRM